MAKIADVKDPEIRAALEKVDSLIGDGDYSAAAKRALETYLRIVEKWPELTPAPVSPNVAPQYTDTLPEDRSRGGSSEGRARRMGWPNQGGIRVTFDGAVASVSYEKQRFSMSEAATYFEFVFDQALRGER